MLLLAAIDLSLAYSMFSADPLVTRRAYLGQEAILPLWVWGWFWMAVSVVLIYNAFRKNDRVGFSAAIAMKALWATAFLVGFVAHDLSRGIISALVWAGIAGWLFLVAGWPEYPPEGKHELE